MAKKFIPLSSEICNAKDPYHIRTWEVPTFRNPPPVIPETLEASPGPHAKDKTRKDMQRLLEKELYRPVEPMYKRDVKKKCGKFDKHYECVRVLRTPQDLKRNAIYREKILKAKEEAEPGLYTKFERPKQEDIDVIKFDDADIKVKKASPSPSFDAAYIPSRKLLELKRPRSGIFINEPTPPWNMAIPYETYNPRKLQKEVDARQQLYNIERREDEMVAKVEKHVLGPLCRCSRCFVGVDPDERCQGFVDLNLPKDFDTLKSGWHRTKMLVIAEKKVKATPVQELNRRQEEFACIFAAFAYSYVKPEANWNVSTLHNILSDGIKLRNLSIKYNYQNEESGCDIIPKLKVGKTPMTLELSLPIYQGDLYGSDSDSLLRNLTEFFKNHLTCVFQSENVFILIWKECLLYKIFDPNGRTEKMERDTEKGFAMLLMARDLRGVADFIIYNSMLGTASDYYLYNLRIKTYNVPDTTKPVKFPKISRHFAIVNRDYVIIRGADGIPPPTKISKNSSLMNAYLGVIYSDIEPGRFWTKKVVDQLRKYGNGVYSKLVKKKKIKSFTVLNLPAVQRVGSFRAEVTIIPFYISGHVYECFNYRTSQLAQAVQKLFNEYEAGLLQIDCVSVALWRDTKFYYMYDPFKRGKAGEYVAKGVKGSAQCLTIYLNLKMLCQLLYANALKSSIQGNFFLHAMKIEQIQLIHVGKAQGEKAQFPSLLLDFPRKCEHLYENPIFGDAGEENKDEKDKKPGEEEEAEEAKKEKEPEKTVKVAEVCLSLLSVSPCERTCSEPDVYEAEKREKAERKKQEKLKEVEKTESVPALKSTEKIPEFDHLDIAQAVLLDIMVVINQKIAKKVGCEGKAGKILLKSDYQHLKGLMQKVKRGQDYDNLFVDFKVCPEVIQFGDTLEKELEIKTSFIPLPDGSWIVRGSNPVTVADNYMLVTGGFAAFAAIILTRKYNVRFWTGEVIDYAMQTTESALKALNINEIVSFLLSSHMPTIQIGEQLMNVTVRKIGKGPAKNLFNMLVSALDNVSSVVVVFNSFTCAVMRKKFFYFLFMGFSCDYLGFRCKENGFPCLIRYMDLESLVRRIHVNRNNDSDGQTALLLSVHAQQTDLKNLRFIQRTESDEELYYQKEKYSLDRKRSRQRLKVLFLRREVKDEKRRIRVFKKIKAKHYGYEDEYGEEMEEEEEESMYEEPEPKHVPGKELPPEEAICQELTHARRDLGYKYRKIDHNFKIQGTNALENRSTESPNAVKPCYFASMFAILYAVHRPLELWDYRRVDKVIENALQLDGMVKDKTKRRLRIIRDVLIDNHIYNIELIAIDPPNFIEDSLRKMTETKKYFMIEFSNCTFAVYKDEHYHLFDPYNSLDVLRKTKNPYKARKLKNVEVSVDLKTSSWVIFPNADFMLAYIEKRVVSPKWQLEFKFHTVNILSIRKAPKKERIAFTMFSIPSDDQLDKTDTDSEIKLEKVSWLELFNGEIPWNPFRSTNIENQKRGTPATVWKEFDIEIPEKLYSLWGNIHPMSIIFKANRGKQVLATNIMACCMAHIYRVDEWNAQIIDTIVIQGDKYYSQSIKNISVKDYELKLEDMDTYFEMGGLFKFTMHVESVVYGLLYNTRQNEFNLSRALEYFFMYNEIGIIQCFYKCLAFGKTKGGYFLFDCQSHGLPLFPENQGAAYALLCNNLEMLLYSIVVTFQITFYNMEFVLHKINIATEYKDEKGKEGEEGNEAQKEEAAPGEPAAEGDE